MSQATHLYFDHPYEPDPEERGLYWAARFIDTEKVFKFIPDDLYSNADYKLTGEPLSMKDIKAYEKRIVKLKIPENIIGKFRMTFSNEGLKICIIFALTS